MTSPDRAHEEALIADYQAGDILAGAALLALHEGLIHTAVRRYQTDRCELEDLLQVGRMALLRAASDFDPARGTRLSTLAFRRMRWAGLNYARGVRSVVAISDDAHYVKGIRVDVVSIDAPLSEGGETVGSRLAAPAPEEAYGVGEWVKPAALVNALSPRERAVVERRFSHDAETLKEIGESMGITRERVRQIEAKALAKMRRAATRRPWAQ